VSEVREWGEREGGRGKKEGKEEYSCGQEPLVCPARLRREEDVSSPVSLGVVSTHKEVATMVTLASYASSQHCASVVTCI